MSNMAFAFEHLYISDTSLRIEIEREILSWKWPSILSLQFRTLNVRTLIVSSTILSSESLYFYKIFNEDHTKKLQPKELTLKIKPSEEAALLDLLNFMYINSLSATMPQQLESVRMMAEKLEATSCIRYVNKLSKALQHEVYSGEPTCASMAEDVQPLKYKATKSLWKRYNDLSNTESQEAAMGLPLCALEFVLGNPDVCVDSEDSLYHFITKWAISNCTYPGEKEKVMEERLFRFIHFPYITPSMDPGLVQGALRLNDGTLYRRSRKIERVYLKHPLCEIKVDNNTVIVYFFLTKKVLRYLYELKRQRSEGILIPKLGGRCFCLEARCSRVKGSWSEHFGLFMCKFTNMPDGVEFVYEFAVLTREDEYRTMSIGDKCSFSGEGETKCFLGDGNMFGVTWYDLMAQDSEFLVDGTLHLRAKITVTATPTKSQFK